MSTRFYKIKLEDREIVDTGRFEKMANRGVASGYASLDANTRLVQNVDDSKIVDTGRFEKMENKDNTGGYAALDGSGCLLAKAHGLYLARNASNNIIFYERTANESVMYAHRAAAEDYSIYLKRGGSWYELALQPVWQGQLKTATARVAGTLNATYTADVDLVCEYAFFPNINATAHMTLQTYYSSGEIPDQSGRLAIYNTSGGTASYFVRFRYIAASIDGLIVLYNNGEHVVSFPAIDDESIINRGFVKVYDKTGKEVPLKREVIYPVTLDNIDTIISQLKSINVDITEFKDRLIKYNSMLKEHIKPYETV